MRTARLPLLALPVLSIALLTTSPAALRASAARAPEECEGDACTQVSITFDETKQLYRVRNNAGDRWVHVTASNLAAASDACLAPGKEEPLALKSISGRYRADYSEPKCGAGGAE